MTPPSGYSGTSPRETRQSEGGRSGRAVSDVIGFTLMFGIIIAGVAVVSVAGVDDVIAFGDREEIQTSERGMEAAAAMMDNLNRQGDVNRSFDLVVGTGNIWLNQTNVTVTGAGGIEDELGDEGEIQLNALEHRFDRSPEDVSVVYEGGGVYRSDGVATHYRPSIAINEDVATVSLVNLTSSDPDIDIAVDFNRDFTIDPTDIPDQSPVAAFAATVNIQANLLDVETYTNRDIDEDDHLKIQLNETSEPDSWAFYLENQGCAVDDDWEATCEDLDEIVFRVVTIDLDRIL